MARTAVLAIRIISDARKAAKDLQGLGDTSGRLSKGMRAASGPAKAVAAGILAIGAAAGKQASDLQQSSGAVESVFGRQAKAVKKLGQNAAGSVGLAQSEYQQLASVLGSQLGNLGVSQGKLVGTTDSLIKKGADLSAMFGGTSKEAVEALSAAMRGETDPIERYGISIKQANVQALLAKRGQDKLTGAAATAAKTQATLDLITQQSAKSQGQFARESDTASGAQQRAEAQIKNAGAALGQVLLPAWAAVATKAAEVGRFVAANSSTFIALAAVLGTVAAVVLTVNAALSAYKAISTAVRVATIVWRNAQMALNLAMTLNPVGLVVLAIVALVAIVVLAYNKVGWFRRGVQAAFRAVVGAVQAAIGWVKRNWPTILAILTGPIGIAVLLITRHWDKIKAGAQTILTKVKSLVGFVRDRLVSGFTAMKDKAVGAFDAMTAPIRNAIDWVQRLIDRIRSIRPPSLGSIGGKIGGIFGIMGGGPKPPPPGPTLFGPGGGMAPSFAALSAGGSSFKSSGRRGGGEPVQIIVQGALDPDAVARQIERLLGDRARRLGKG